MVRTRKRHVGDLGHGSVTEPREVLEANESRFPSNDDRESVTRHVLDVNQGSAAATPRGSHARALGRYVVLPHRRNLVADVTSRKRISFKTVQPVITNPA